MKNKFLISSLAVLAIIVSACASATPMNPTETVAPVMAATTASTSAPSEAMPSGPATINVAQDASLGSILVDLNGMTLYLYTSDTPNTSTCTATLRHEFAAPQRPMGHPLVVRGVTASMLGTTTRSDGSTQVTYNGLPLYYFAGDKTAGDAKGEGVKSVWYAVSPSGMSVVATSAASISSGAAVVNVGQNATLGSFLVDLQRLLPCIFTQRTHLIPVIATELWHLTRPPLLTTGTPTAGIGVTASMLGTTTRTDETTQVTYNGWPLYYYASDKAAGDTTGENVQGVWYVITPDGVQK